MQIRKLQSRTCMIREVLETEKERVVEGRFSRNSALSTTRLGWPDGLDPRRSLFPIPISSCNLVTSLLTVDWVQTPPSREGLGDNVEVDALFGDPDKQKPCVCKRKIIRTCSFMSCSCCCKWLNSCGVISGLPLDFVWHEGGAKTQQKNVQ